MGVRVARKINRLSAKGVSNQRTPGYFPDGAGLYLQVSASGSKSWIFRYTLNGKPREMGLGSALAIDLADARSRAAACRLLLSDGIDPIETRNAQKAQTALEQANTVSFKTCAEAYIDVHSKSWSNAKHAAQWKSTLTTYCYPLIGALPVQTVDTDLVVRVLQPIWTQKPETASRLRGRIESILDRATTKRYRSGENPARWKGHLDDLLPSLSKESRVKHHAALPYSQVASFVKSVRAQEGTAARALEFTILTAARTAEAIGARPAEFDLAKSLWTIPASRMKAGREHRVPLSRRAIELLRAQFELDAEYVFPGLGESKPLSNMAMLALLRRMDRSDLTVHGFRSTFRDWAAEQTAYPHEVCEMALAHAVGDKVEAAYRRGDLFEKRQHLAADWAKYCEQGGKTSNVTPTRKTRQKRKMN